MPRYKFEYEVEARCEEEAWEIAGDNFGCFQCSDVDPEEPEEGSDKPELVSTKCECQFPTDSDLDYMEKTLHRHHSGTAGWMKEILSEDGEEEGARTIIDAIISVWEAGRAKAAIPE